MNSTERKGVDRDTRVLFVAAMGGLGGPVRRLATLLVNLDGVERVLLKPASERLDTYLRGYAAVDEHIATKRSAQRDRLGSLQIAFAVLRRSLSRHRRIDVIHANGLVEYALCWPAAFLLRIPVVTWVGNYEPPGLVRRFSWLIRRTKPRTQWCAVSSFAAGVIEETGLCRRDEVAVVTNIVDPNDVQRSSGAAEFDEAPPAQDADLPVRIAYLQVARWVKGFDLLAPMINELEDLQGRFVLQVYGTPSDQPGWEELRALPAGTVELRERTADVSEIYQDCDIVLSPSRRESFNRVVAEALTAGVPVVASDIEPVREVVGDAGLLFGVDVVAGGAAGLRRLIDDPDLRAELGRRGRVRAEHWAPKPVAEGFRDRYADLRDRPRDVVEWPGGPWRVVRVEVRQGDGTRGRKGPERPEKRDEIVQVTGLDKVPGSLNLRSAKRVWLRRRAGIAWSHGRLYPARLGDLDVAFTKLDKFAGAPHMFHVYAERHLRTELGVSDGDIVELRVPAAAFVRQPLFHELLYRLRLLRSRLSDRRQHR